MLIINRENWGVVKKKNIIGSRNEKVKLIKKNDIILVYIIKPLCSIVGAFNVESYVYSKNILFKGGLYPHRLNLTPIKVLENPIDIKTLIQSLDFILNKIKWNGHFLGVRGVRKLSNKDFNTIYDVINSEKR